MRADIQPLRLATWFGLAGLLLITCPLWAGEPPGSPLEVTFGTDRQSYVSGDPISFQLTTCNPTDEPVVASFVPCPCCHEAMTIFDDEGAEVAELTPGCILSPIFITWEPDQCRIFAWDWPQRDGNFTSNGSGEGQPVPPGRYRSRLSWTPGFLVPVELETEVVIVADVPVLSWIGALVLASALAAVGLRRLAIGG